MDESIKKIVSDYINDKEFEKALSLLKATANDDTTDTELFDACKKGFVDQCTASITEAIKTGNKAEAEKILANYEKLLGTDSNSAMYRALIDSMPTKPSAAAALDKATSAVTNLSGIFENCQPDLKKGKPWIMWVLYGFLAIITFFIAAIGDNAPTIIISTIALAIALGYPVMRCENRKFKIVALILLFITVFFTFVYYADGIGEYQGEEGKLFIPWLLSLPFVVVYYYITPSKSKAFKYITCFLLFTVFNPLTYGLEFSPATETYKNVWGSDSWEYTLYYKFTSVAPYYIWFSVLGSLIIYTISFVGFKSIKEKIVSYKKQIGIVAASIVGLIVVIFIVAGIKSSYDARAAEREAVEQARQDSIQAVENARLAAIERARQDSIDAIRAKERARLDSIDYAEHAGFVSKYANIGLIITEVRMTSGQNENGIGTKGIKFTIFNPTHKTIKYVIVSATAVNKFGDRMSYEERCRGIGPVGSHEYGSWEFEDVFPDKNGVIDDLKVAFQVVYTNGSSKTLRWKDAYVDSFKESWFRDR